MQKTNPGNTERNGSRNFPSAVCPIILTLYLGPTNPFSKKTIVIFHDHYSKSLDFMDVSDYLLIM
jgi:hypothetical protein